MADVADAPDIPRDADGPVFAEPWQARAFAIVVKLCGDGHYSWDDFRDRLTAEIGTADAAGDDVTGYYEHWLAACETLLAERGIAAVEELAACKAYLAVNRPPPTEAVDNPVVVDPGRGPAPGDD
jgi:nitrile hydratase accessory protein